MKINRIDIKGEVYDIEAYENPIPTGSVIPFAGITAPEGFLLCNGQGVSRFTYAKLYGVIGDTYGAGDGTTTFNLPNLIDKFVQGGKLDTVGNIIEPGLPNILGNITATVDNKILHWGKGSGATQGKDYESFRDSTIDDRMLSGYQSMQFDASESNPIYGKSETVQPPAVKMQYIIKT